MIGLRLRFIGPILLITLCLILLCAFTAISLFAQQAAITRILSENIESRRAAARLEECLSDLIDLENDQVEKVSVIHKRALNHIGRLKILADQSEEKSLYVEIDKAFGQYLEHWTNLPSTLDPNHESARNDATKLLEKSVLAPCQSFKQFNADRIEKSTEDHETTLRQLAWGLAGIGTIGTIAGIVLGYGVTSELSRSIRRLRVQIRNAAGKLDPNAAEIVLTELGDFSQLHTDLDKLSKQIEGMVHELHQREHEILRAEQLAAVGQAAAGVAHEVRNPLTAIKLLVQSAREGRDDLTLDDLQIMETEIRRAESSLQTFLDFARPPKLVRDRTELTGLIQTVVQLLRGRIDRQKVQLQLNMPRQPVFVHADAEQLRRVILNICMNALDMMPQGGMLTISLTLRSPNESLIEITDSGPGISKKIFPRLFEPFASEKDTGLGLGLPISKRIVEDHGGTIGAANRAGGGASFFVHLPHGG